jgi:hypothetical protein
MLPIKEIVVPIANIYISNHAKVNERIKLQSKRNITISLSI